MRSLYEKARLGAQACDVHYLRRLLLETGRASLRGDDDPEQLTPLHLAALMGCKKTVRFLIDEAGADPTKTGADNFSALHCAAMNGHTEVCRLLLEHGANANLQTNFGYAPIHSASWAGHVGVIQLLLEHRAQTGLLNYRGETPLETARRQGQTAAEGLLRSSPVLTIVAEQTEDVPIEREIEGGELQSPDLIELGTMAEGLEVIHEPSVVRGYQGGRSGFRYTWEYRTSVMARGERLVIEQFGAFGTDLGRWSIGTETGKPYTPAMFADWYACPDAVLEPDAPAVDEANWTGMDDATTDLTLWYYIARDPTGKRVKGQAIVELLYDDKIK